MFSFFKKKKSPEEQLRERLGKEFDNAARKALKQGCSDPFIGAMMVQASVGSLYQELKKSNEMETLCILYGINYQALLEEECNRVLDKYLKR